MSEITNDAVKKMRDSLVKTLNEANEQLEADRENKILRIASEEHKMFAFASLPLNEMYEVYFKGERVGTAIRKTMTSIEYYPDQDLKRVIVTGNINI